MVPVEVAEIVAVVCEVNTASTSVVNEPDASAKRPVPPVIVEEALTWNRVAETGQPTSVAVLKILSPFAAVKVSCSVAVSPPLQSAVPVVVAVATRVVSPR